MNLVFLASLIVFILFLYFHLKRQRKLQENQEKNFWERERLANSVILLLDECSMDAVSVKLRILSLSLWET